MKMKILNLDDALLSDRNGTYGGAAGSKEGILMDGQYWLVKYPQNTRSMQGELDSYTTSPLSEYLGSHIYDILGYSAHQTALGTRNGKLVVACRDFCEYPGELREMRTIKNTYNAKLEQLLETGWASTGSKSSVDLQEILIHLDHNPILAGVPKLKEQFWNCVLVDGLINNNDRNNGNWGLLYHGGRYQIAPVFDNGAAFSNKATEQILATRLGNNQKLEASALNTISIYSKDEKNYTFRNLLDECIQYPDFCAALKRNVPLMEKCMPKIKQLLDEVPESYQGIPVCSAVRKEVYWQGMQARFNKLLIPALEKVLQAERQQQPKTDRGDLRQWIADASAKADERNAANAADRRRTEVIQEQE